ncbi:MAG: hypothetical protein ABW189_02415 [Rickettsiales bacterium]
MTPRFPPVPSICMAYGDGPARLMAECVMTLLKRVGTKASYKMLEIGNEAYRRGYDAGVSEGDLESVRQADAVLQAPGYLGLRQRPLLPPEPKADGLIVPFSLDDARAAYRLPYSPFAGAEAAITPGYALFCMTEPEKMRPLYPESADPTGLVLAACLMLSYLERQNEAFLLQAAFMRTLEEGVHPYGFYVPGRSKECVGVDGLTEAVSFFIGKTPRRLRVSNTEKPFVTDRALLLKSLRAQFRPVPSDVALSSPTA